MLIKFQNISFSKSKNSLILKLHDGRDLAVGISPMNDLLDVRETNLATVVAFTKNVSLTVPEGAEVVNHSAGDTYTVLFGAEKGATRTYKSDGCHIQMPEGQEGTTPQFTLDIEVNDLPPFAQLTQMYGGRRLIETAEEREVANTPTSQIPVAAPVAVDGE